MTDLHALTWFVVVIGLVLAIFGSAALWFSRAADDLEDLPPPREDERSSIEIFRRINRV